MGEALECHGGSGYIEESIMPRLYREAPLNGIWEGSGNVICLDVLRAIQREPLAISALLAELDPARGIDPELDRAITHLKEDLDGPVDLEVRARSLTERIAVTLQAALLTRHAPEMTARAFRASRLSGNRSAAFGTLPADTSSGVAQGLKTLVGATCNGWPSQPDRGRATAGSIDGDHPRCDPIARPVGRRWRHPTARRSTRWVYDLG